MNGPVPYHLKPKATKLPAGHDDSLDPPEPPTDPEQRGLPLNQWPAVDTSKGSDRPPDAPLSPPAVNPAVRSVPASTWPRTPPAFIPGRSVRETFGKVPGTLDPDIALWQAVVVSIWPFTGAPTEGEFPQGWLGVDNTGTLYVCKVAGEPGTWAAVGATGPAGGWPTNNGSGPGNLEAETPEGDTVGYNFTDGGSGGFNVNAPNIALGANDNVTLEADTGDLSLEAGGAAQLIGESIAITPGSGGMTEVLSSAAGHLATDYTVTESLATYLTTPSLAVGKWLFAHKATVTTVDGQNVSIVANEGTATATLEGATSDELAAASSELLGPLTLAFIATITVAGTLVFQAQGSTTGMTISAETPVSDLGHATGYTALRIQ